MFIVLVNAYVCFSIDSLNYFHMSGFSHRKFVIIFIKLLAGTTYAKILLFLTNDLTYYVFHAQIH